MVREVRLVEEIEIPEGVEVSIEGMKVTVSGPKGKVVRDFSFARGIRIFREGSEVKVETFFADRKRKALLYSIAAHIENMIEGVLKGYRYKLKIIYQHFPISVKVDGDRVIIENFLGEKAPRVAKIVGDVKVKVTRDEIVVEGVDIESVGQTAANIELATKIKGFDRRVFVDGIYIYEKGHMEG